MQSTTVTLPTPTYEAPAWLDRVVEGAIEPSGLTVWTPTPSLATSAWVRAPRYPEAVETDASVGRHVLDAVRNERRACQVVVASPEPIDDLRCTPSPFERADGTTISRDAFDVRFVGYVPFRRALRGHGESAMVEERAGVGISGDQAPDVVGDPLFDRDRIDVPARQAQPIWITIDVPTSIPAGTYEGTIAITADGYESVEIDVRVEVDDVTVPAPAESAFHLDVWFNPDAVATRAGVERWSDAHWDRLGPYFEALAAAGQETVAASIVHEPWQREWPGGEWRPQTETGFESLVEWRYDGEWDFGFGRFDRYVETAHEHGLGPTVAAYSMLPFRGRPRLTYVDDSGERVVERADVGSDRWREAWTAFLERFSTHLDARGWLEDTWLAFDERPPDIMSEAIDLVERVAPAFTDRIQVAGTPEVASFAADFSTSVRHLPLDPGLLADRRRAGERTTFYTSVATRRPNTFTVSPAIESRLLPWIAATHGLDGYLRWAFNSWPDDVFEHPVYRFEQGDEYLVYPGESGPVSSVRWEQLLAGIQEYALLDRLHRDRPEVADAAMERATCLDRDPAETREALYEARRAVVDALQ